MYIVLEIQKDNNTLSLLNTTHETLNEAESKYHTILAYAAQSTLTLHGAVLLTEEGQTMRSECYKHEQQNNSEE